MWTFSGRGHDNIECIGYRATAPHSSADTPAIGLQHGLCSIEAGGEWRCGICSDRSRWEGWSLLTTSAMSDAEVCRGRGHSPPSLLSRRFFRANVITCWGLLRGRMTLPSGPKLPRGNWWMKIGRSSWGIQYRIKIHFSWWSFRFRWNRLFYKWNKFALR